MVEQGPFDPLFHEIAEYLRAQRARTPNPEGENIPTDDEVSLEPPRRPTRLISKWEERVFAGAVIGIIVSSSTAIISGLYLNNEVVAAEASRIFFLSLIVGTAIGLRGIVNAIRNPRF